MSGRIHKKKSKVPARIARLRLLKGVRKQVGQSLIEAEQSDMVDVAHRLRKLAKKIDDSGLL